jgi:hypothetical protein
LVQWSEVVRWKLGCYSIQDLDTDLCDQDFKLAAETSGAIHLLGGVRQTILYVTLAVP